MKLTLIIFLFITSCSFEVNSDGSKSGSISAEGIVNVIKATK